MKHPISSSPVSFCNEHFQWAFAMILCWAPLIRQLCFHNGMQNKCWSMISMLFHGVSCKWMKLHHSSPSTAPATAASASAAHQTAYPSSSTAATKLFHLHVVFPRIPKPTKIPSSHWASASIIHQLLLWSAVSTRILRYNVGTIHSITGSRMNRSSHSTM